MSYRIPALLRRIRCQSANWSINRPINQNAQRQIHRLYSTTNKLLNPTTSKGLIRLSALSIVIMASLPRIAPVDGETVIRSLNQSIKLFSAPFNVHQEIGVRMSAIQTKAGIVLYNPIHLEPASKRELGAMNSEVKFIIAPNLAHHMFLDAAAAAYPNATVIGPAGLAEKHPSIDRSRFTEVNQPNGSGITNFPYDEVEIAYFPDFLYKEICVHHRSSKTLFVCDMLFNLPATEQYSQVADKSRINPSGMQKTMQKFMDKHANAAVYETDWVPRLFQWFHSKKTDQFKEQADRMVNQWQPQVIVPQHGDVIEKDATDIITKRFASTLGSKK